MLAAASNNHSGRIASNKLAILKEAVCFRFVTQILLTQIGEFISAPPHSSCMSKERRRHADGGGWVLASGERAVRTSAFRVRTAQRPEFYSVRVNLAAFSVLPPPFDPGFGSGLASSSFRMVGYTDISTRNFRIAGDPAILCLIVLSEGTRLGPIAGTGGQTWTTSGTGRNRGKL